MSAKSSSNDDYIKIALMTDLNVDYSYMEGAKTNCGKALCCRFNSGSSNKEETRAKKWGEYTCDLPERTFESMLDFMSKLIRPDMLFWGGNNVHTGFDTLVEQEYVKTM